MEYDFEMTITARDGKLSFQGKDICLADVARTVSFLQIYLGLQATRQGMEAEESKSRLLDICQDAMMALDDILAEGRVRYAEEKVHDE